jgi:multiple sugar transport system permease protein
MGLVARTGRRSFKTRVLLTAMVLVLTAGAVSMVLPFALMLTGSTRTGVDQASLSWWPEFLRDDAALFQKYMEGLYNESPAQLRAAWEVDSGRFDHLVLRELTEADREKVEAWEAFVDAWSPESFEMFAGFVYCPESRGRPWNVRRFLHMLYDQVDGSISRANRELGTSFPDWNTFRVLPPDTRSRLGVHADSPWWQAWYRFRESGIPDWSKGVHTLNGFYHERVVLPQLGPEADRRLLSFRMPEEKAARERWELFVRGVVHPDFVEVASTAADAWQQYLMARYVDLDTFREVTGRTNTSWQEVELPRRYRQAGVLQPDWLDWLQGWLDPGNGARFQMPLAALQLRSVDLAWREKTGEAPPIALADQMQFEENRVAIRRLFLTQNFGTVWEILILHGRGVWVTVVYCLGSVLIALIVNPMAAYALSRYRPRHTYSLLLYLLLTMAFPPMVTQIPLFLMLRDFHLLNTFWALLLPGMAHGYSIFLLKGFFDSLPRDLYESASLDGAGELRMFVTITLSLSKPILAVIALSAFANAYTNFMFALLICQHERMWTLMVWLYQLQQNYGSGVMNAAFVLAAVPTLLVFLVAQRQILKGIVIPTEK